MLSFPLEAKTGHSRHWKNQRMGNQDNDAIIPFSKEKRRDVAMVWVSDEKVNAVIFSLKMCKWRSTRWWQSLHTRMMKEDPRNRIRWKHKWR